MTSRNDGLLLAPLLLNGCINGEVGSQLFVTTGTACTSGTELTEFDQIPHSVAANCIDDLLFTNTETTADDTVGTASH